MLQFYMKVVYSALSTLVGSRNVSPAVGLTSGKGKKNGLLVCEKDENKLRLSASVQTAEDFVRSDLQNVFAHT